MHVGYLYSTYLGIEYERGAHKNKRKQKETLTQVLCSHCLMLDQNNHFFFFFFFFLCDVLPLTHVRV